MCVYIYIYVGYCGVKDAGEGLHHFEEDDNDNGYEGEEGRN